MSSHHGRRHRESLEKQEKDLDRLPFQPDSGAGLLTQFTGTEIEFERSKANRV